MGRHKRPDFSINTKGSFHGRAVVDNNLVNSRRAPTRNLDVLRATAVLLVAFDHLLDNGFQWLGHSDDMLPAAGRLGVMIFFVHTSLVLMLSIFVCVSADSTWRLHSIYAGSSGFIR